jgi:hypothetical protein
MRVDPPFAFSDSNNDKLSIASTFPRPRLHHEAFHPLTFVSLTTVRGILLTNALSIPIRLFFPPGS